MREQMTGLKRTRLALGLMLAGVAAGAAMADTTKRPGRSECVCMAVCQTRANGGRLVTRPGKGCANIHEQLIYDNMARCACQPLRRPVKRPEVGGRQSPNH